ncbi:helix-turn-helix domain-containing protein [Dickeya zeae]|uniref:helix-turn-helix domain-containing protein n=1 Tax=Dickeya zeae TaxID=204042 RepID=UPI002159D4B4|nr:helix-turn-helix transcriptional regulator [Dickeya zeae]
MDFPSCRKTTGSFLPNHLLPYKNNRQEHAAQQPVGAPAQNLAALSRSAGLSSSTLANVLVRPWPKGEWLVATALDKHPAEIWPSRYFDETGTLIDRKRRIRQERGK